MNMKKRKQPAAAHSEDHDVELTEIIVSNGDSRAQQQSSQPVPTFQKLKTAIKARDSNEIKNVILATEAADGSHASPASHPTKIQGAGADQAWTESLRKRSKVYYISKEELAEALYLAVKEDDVDCVRAILNTVDINVRGYRDNRGYTAVHIACENGNVEVVHAILEKDRKRAGLFQSDHGPSPAMLAAERGHAEVLSLILREKSWLTRTGGDVQLFFVIAARKGHLGILEMLKEKYAIMRTTFNRALVAAADAGHEECIRLILSSADVNVDYQTEPADSREVRSDRMSAGDGVAQTALHRCVIKSHPECARLLLASKANPNIGDKLGSTPLYYATLMVIPDMVKLLLEFGADPDTEIMLGGSSQVLQLPLHVAASNGDTDILQLLLKKTTKLAAKDGEGRNCLHVACQTGLIQNIEMILKEGILDPRETDTHANTPVHCAAAWGKLEAVRFLVEKDDVYVPRAKNKDGNTVLHLASSAGADRNLVQALVDKGESINARNAEYKTPLHLAILADDPYCAEELCELGADITLRDKEGNSPWKLLVVSMPVLVQKILDKMITVADENIHGKHAKVNISFNSLTPAASRKKSSNPDTVNAAHALYVAQQRHAMSSSADAVNHEPYSHGPYVAFSAVADTLMAHQHGLSTMPQTAGSGDRRPSLSWRRFSISAQAHDEALWAERKMTDTDLFSELFAYGVPPLILHPVSWIFVKLKWRYYKIYWWIYLFFNLSFVICYLGTLFQVHNSKENGAYQLAGCWYPTKRFWEKGLLWRGLTYCLALVVGLLEGFQAWRKEKRSALQGAINWATVALVAIVVLLLPQHYALLQGYTDCAAPYLHYTSSGAMVGIFVHFMIVTSKNPDVGLYVSLFVKMTQIFLEFLLHYIWIVVCSALLLYLLLHNNENLTSYSSLWKSFAKALIMMNGEFEYENTFNVVGMKPHRTPTSRQNITEPESPPSSPSTNTTHEGTDDTSSIQPIAEVFFLLFVLVISMLLGNLLISMSVNQLQTLLHEATIMRLQFTMELIQNVERILPCDNCLFFLSSRDTIAHFLPNDIANKNKLFCKRPKKSLRSFYKCEKATAQDDTIEVIHLEKEIRAEIMDIAQTSRRYGGRRESHVVQNPSYLLARRMTNPEMAPEMRRLRQGSQRRLVSRVFEQPPEIVATAAMTTNPTAGVDQPKPTTAGATFLVPPPSLPPNRSSISPDLDRRLRNLEVDLQQRIDATLAAVLTRGRSAASAELTRGGSTRRKPPR